MIRKRGGRRGVDGDAIQGVLIFDRQGLLSHADPAVAEVLAGPTGTTIMRRLGQAVRQLLSDGSNTHAAEETHPLGRDRQLRVRLLRSMSGGNVTVLGLVALHSDVRLDLEVLAERARLTPREIDVAMQVRAGLEDEEIGRQLGIAPLTVRWHVRNVLRKTELPDRDALTRLSGS